MLAHADDDIKIARCAALRPRVAFAADSYALAVTRARFYAHLQRLCALHSAFPVAHRTWRLHFAGAAAARTGNVELHPAAGLRDVAAAMALRTRCGRSHHAATVAVGAGIKASDVQAHYRAANRVPEADIHLVFKIGAVLRLGFNGRAATTAAKDAGKKYRGIRPPPDRPLAPPNRKSQIR